MESVSPGAGRESMVGRIYETVRFYVKSRTVWETLQLTNHVLHSIQCNEMNSASGALKPHTNPDSTEYLVDLVDMVQIKPEQR